MNEGNPEPKVEGTQTASTTATTTTAMESKVEAGGTTGTTLTSRRAVIPKDLSKYPDFPDIEQLRKEGKAQDEIDDIIKKYWSRHSNAKKREKKKLKTQAALETKNVGVTKEPAPAVAAAPSYAVAEKKQSVPKAGEATTKVDDKTPRIRIPANPADYPGFPDVEKLRKEGKTEDDVAEVVSAFWKRWRNRRSSLKQKERRAAARAAKAEIEAKAATSSKKTNPKPKPKVVNKRKENYQQGSGWTANGNYFDDSRGERGQDAPWSGGASYGGGGSGGPYDDYYNTSNLYPNQDFGGPGPSGSYQDYANDRDRDHRMLVEVMHQDLAQFRESFVCRQYDLLRQELDPELRPVEIRVPDLTGCYSLMEWKDRFSRWTENLEQAVELASTKQNIRNQKRQHEFGGHQDFPQPKSARYEDYPSYSNDRRMSMNDSMNSGFPMPMPGPDMNMIQQQQQQSQPQGPNNVGSPLDICVIAVMSNGDDILNYVKSKAKYYANALDQRNPDGRKLVDMLVNCGKEEVMMVPCPLFNKDNSCDNPPVHLDRNYTNRIHACALCFFTLDGMTNFHRLTHCPLLSYS